MPLNLSSQVHFCVCKLFIFQTSRAGRELCKLHNVSTFILKNSNISTTIYNQIKFRNSFLNQFLNFTHINIQMLFGILWLNNSTPRPFLFLPSENEKNYFYNGSVIQNWFSWWIGRALRSNFKRKFTQFSGRIHFAEKKWSHWRV